MYDNFLKWLNENATAGPVEEEEISDEEFLRLQNENKLKKEKAAAEKSNKLEKDARSSA